VPSRTFPPRMRMSKAIAAETFASL